MPSWHLAFVHGGHRSDLVWRDAAIQTGREAALQSPVAVAASIQVVRAFVRLRALLVQHGDLTRRLDALEAQYDRQFKVVFDAIRALMTPPEKPARRIGFRAERRP